MKDTFRLCRKCGRPIGVIRARVYRSIIVDAETLLVMHDKLGDTFIRIDGSKIRGRKADFEEEATYGIPGGPEYAYRPHNCNEV